MISILLHLPAFPAKIMSFTFLAFFALSACQNNKPRSTVSVLDISIQQHDTHGIQLSRQKADSIHNKLLHYFPESGGPVVKEYVNRIAKKITDSLPAIKYCCKFYIIRMNTINAFSLPNGNVYITIKLLKLINSEAQLAAILSHEIAHVAAKHSVKNLNSKFTSYKVYKELQRRAQSSRQNDISRTLRYAYEKGYKRETEREADSLGLKYMTIAGYHPIAMTELFVKIKAHFRNKPQHQKYMKLVYTRDRGIFASYPSFDDRIKNTHSVITEHIQPKIDGFPAGLIHGRESFAPIKAELRRGSSNKKRP